MAKILIEDYDPSNHKDPMGYVDGEDKFLAWQHSKTDKIVPHKVCILTVCGFTFEFHRLRQIEQCLEYYRKEHHPSSKRQVGIGLPDHEEVQQWYERLPLYLLERPKRKKVIAALERALKEYSKFADDL
jgi:hypothetical protein